MVPGDWTRVNFLSKNSPARSANHSFQRCMTTTLIRGRRVSYTSTTPKLSQSLRRRYCTICRNMKVSTGWSSSKMPSGGVVKTRNSQAAGVRKWLVGSACSMSATVTWRTVTGETRTTDSRRGKSIRGVRSDFRWLWITSWPSWKCFDSFRSFWESSSLLVAERNLLCGLVDSLFVYFSLSLNCVCWFAWGLLFFFPIFYFP